MRSTLLALALCCFTRPVAAQLTTTYAGTQVIGGKQVAATAKFAVEAGRVAMIMTGERGGRMVFDEKAQVLHMINDEDKSYLDVNQSAGGAGSPMDMMQKQLEKLPAEQRAMAQQMMKSAMPPGAAPQLTYTWTKDTKTVLGYECTRVEGMRGDIKVTEYCGSTSPDFKMSDAERSTMLDMQRYLRNFAIMVRSPDDATRAFQWDTSVDGYPVITRCFRDGVMTLDLSLQSVSRAPLPAELFAIPRDYRKIDLPAMGGRP
ncbi:MAG TPA: hypothetical protein VJO33_20125 [Gemmatimonadaceae bacterium]|nr:hypothetical protein [Gemmatimonadaceae bacterium]